MLDNLFHVGLLGLDVLESFSMTKQTIAHLRGIFYRKVMKTIKRHRKNHFNRINKTVDKLMVCNSSLNDWTRNIPEAPKNRNIISRGIN